MKQSFLKNLLSDWGTLAVRRSRRVLAVAVALGVLATPFAIQALRNIDVNLFNQASSELKRFHLLRELTETFGGDMLLGVASIPVEHSPKEVEELKLFGEQLSAELAVVGRLDEDQAELASNLRAEITVLDTRAKTPEPAHSDTPGPLDSAELEPAPELGKPDTRPPAWLRNVECRTGQSIEGALKMLARQRPYVLLETSDVDALKKLFDPAALDARMAEIDTLVLELEAHSPEKKKLYEDPLGILDFSRKALESRLKKRAPPLANDAGGYFLSSDGTTLVVIGRAVLPSSRLDFSRALMAAAQRAENRAVLRFRKTQPQLSTALKGARYGDLAAGQTPGRLNVGFTGMPAVYVENERTLKWDLILNTGTSLLGVLILFLIVYRSVALTWKATWTTIYTIWLTLAFAGLTRGGMSLLGGAFTAVPVGLGTDYAILIYNTYQNLRAKEGLSVEEAMRRALGQCGPSILTAAAITAIAFYGVGFTHLTGLAEFGILGGTSALIGCAVMLLVLPASLVSSGENANAATASANVGTAGLTFGMPTLGRWLENKSARAITLSFSVLVLAGGILFIRFGPDPGPETVAGVRFDPELGNLRSLDNRAISLREHVGQRFKTGLSDINTAVDSPNEDIAFAAQERMLLRVQPYIERGELKPNGGVLDYMPSPRKQRESIAALRTFDIDKSIGNFQAAAEKRFGLKGAGYFKPFLRRLRDFKVLLAEPKPLTLAEVMDGPLANVLAPYARLDGKGGVVLRSSWLPTDAKQPSQWYTQLAETLETPLTKTEPEAGRVRMTAAKMVGYELKETTLHDCGGITLAVSICVALSLAAALRSLKSCVIALIPLVFAYLMMLVGVPISQLLHWDYTLNFVNLIMFPLLLGSAVDYGVYMVLGFDGERPPLRELMAQTGRSVLYCMGTTLIGFGSFVTSSYTGLLSMGVASLWGYAGATFGALVVLPAVLGCFKNPK